MSVITPGESSLASSDYERMQVAADRIAARVTPLLVEIGNKYPRADLTGLVSLVAQVSPSVEEIMVESNASEAK